MPRPRDRAARWLDLRPVAGARHAWSATDALSGRPVSVALHPGLGADLTRARAAFAATGAARSPGLARPLDVWADERGLWWVEEALPGRSLDRALVEGPWALSASEVVALARQILSAVGALHAVGARHGDLAPEFVWVDARGPGRVDAAIVGAGRVQCGLVAARNLAFRAPELAPDALADDATERFAVGALLWTISVGRAPLLPFAGRAEALVRRVGGVPALRAHRADLPGALYDLVDSWTAEDPGRRTVHPELLAPPRAPSPAPARPTPARPRGTSRPSGAPPRPGPDALTGELRRILSLIDGRRADLGPAMATLLRAAALDLEGVVADVRVDRATLAALGAREASARTNDGAVAVAAAEQALADESAAVDRRYDEALAATRRLQADLVEALSNSAAITRAIERMLADLDHARAAIAEIDALDGPARRP